MTGGAADWGKELDTAFEQELNDLKKEIAELAQTGINRLVDRSPVKSGTFKGNWVVSVGEPVAGAIKTTDKDGADTKARAAAALAGYAENGEFLAIYLQNHVAYAEELEAGKSDQAPLGLLALTAAELAALWEAKS